MKKVEAKRVTELTYGSYACRNCFDMTNREAQAVGF